MRFSDSYSHGISPQPQSSRQRFRSGQVYLIGVVALLLGGAGYFGFWTHSASSSSSSSMPSTADSQGAAASYSAVHPAPTVDQMMQMADVQASTLLEKSKAQPRNASLLIQIASVYQGAHQFREAAGYYRQALTIDPKNANARTQMASCLFYSGQVDEALDQLQVALKSAPRNVNALFNLGMIKYKGKNDPTGAIAAWQQLLKDNPNLDRKPIVEKMIAEAEADGAVAQARQR